MDAESERILADLPELALHGRASWRAVASAGGRAAFAGPLATVGVLAVAGFQVGEGNLSAGEVLAAVQYAMLGAGLGSLTGVLGSLARAKAAVSRLNEIHEVPALEYGESGTPRGRRTPRTPVLTVKGESRPLLENVSLTIPAGAAAAVVGGSGSGKSVLAAVIARLRDPDEGAVLLDGVRAQAPGRETLRDAVGIATERPVLAGETLADAMGPGRPRKEVEAAAAKVGADGFAERLPEGYDTPLEAVPMSGGEAQRIGLARAWRAERLLVLDDATGALDAVSELQIDEALAEGSRTRITVTHKSEAAAQADLVGVAGARTSEGFRTPTEPCGRTRTTERSSTNERHAAHESPSRNSNARTSQPVKTMPDPDRHRHRHRNCRTPAPCSNREALQTDAPLPGGGQTGAESGGDGAVRPLLRYAASGLRPRAILALFLWSIPETLPTAVFGLVIARALDDGFLIGRPWTGTAWLAGLLFAAAIGAFGTRGLYACLGTTVESFRDRLVCHVICHALQTSVAGHPDTGAVSRLARQVEIARDSYAGVILAVRGCLVTAIGVTAGLLALDPLLALIILPPFLLGLFAFIATLGFAAERHRRAAEADEHLAERVAQVAAAVPDLAACGGEDRGAELVAAPIARLAAAERALAGAAAMRAVCFAVGGWLPLLAVLAAAPWLADRGLTAGALTGALLYVLTGLQPALTALVNGLGSSGLRLCVALSRILNSGPAAPASRSEADPDLAHGQGESNPDASTPLGAAAAEPPAARHAASAVTDWRESTSRATTTAPPPPVLTASATTGAPPAVSLIAHDLTFAYGPHAAPAVAGLDLTVTTGDHLAIIGPSGIGKSTLAGLLCGLLRPDSGTIAYVPAIEAISPAESASLTTGSTADTLAPNKTGPASPMTPTRADFGGATLPTTADLARLRVLIPQEAYVFTGTVRANLRYLRPDATDAELTVSASAVGAAPLVDRLGGLDATIDPRRLSAGERQLLALARAHCSPAPIAVLDEATCHLDPAAEARAEAAFAARGTLIVIAHRASSAMRARRVLILDGRTAAIGDHEHLRDGLAYVSKAAGALGNRSRPAMSPDSEAPNLPSQRTETTDPPPHEPEASGARSREAESARSSLPRNPTPQPPRPGHRTFRSPVPGGPGSDPAGLLSDAHGVDPAARARFVDRVRQVVADRPHPQVQRLRDLAGRRPRHDMAQDLLLPLRERVRPRPHDREGDRAVHDGLAPGQPPNRLYEPLEGLPGGHEPHARREPDQIGREARPPVRVDQEEHAHPRQGGADRLRHARRQ